MSALSDLMQIGQQVQPGNYAYQVPQYRLQDTLPAINENEAISKTRLNEDFLQRTLPGMSSAGAARGQTGSTGLNKRIGFAQTDYLRQFHDLARTAALNRSSIQTQNALATFGGLGL